MEMWGGEGGARVELEYKELEYKVLKPKEQELDRGGWAGGAVRVEHTLSRWVGHRASSFIGAAAAVGRLAI